MSRVADKWDSKLRTRAPSTRRNYTIYLNRFLERFSLTMDELYRLHLKSSRAVEPIDRNDVEEKVQLYMSELIEKGYKAGTAKQVYKAVRFFLRACGLTFELLREDKPKVVNERTLMMQSSEIRDIYQEHIGAEMKERNRALLMLLKDSGLRVSDAVKMNVEHYIEAEEKEDHQGRFKVFLPRSTRKTGEFSHVILGPEAVDAVDKYLALDERSSGPLFLRRLEPVIDETAEETMKARKNHHKRKVISYQEPERLKAKTASQIFLRLREKLKEPYKKSAHSLRYFHFNRLQASGMQESWIHFLQGKRNFKNYTQALGVREEVTSRYMDAYENLRVFDDITLADIERDSKLADLEARIDKQKKDIEFLNTQLINAWFGQELTYGAYEVIKDEDGKYRAKDPELRRLLEILHERKVLREKE